VNNDCIELRCGARINSRAPRVKACERCIGESPTSNELSRGLTPYAESGVCVSKKISVSGVDSRASVIKLRGLRTGCLQKQRAEIETPQPSEQRRLTDRKSRIRVPLLSTPRV
jgi:hypothetical protein